LIRKFLTIWNILFFPTAKALSPADMNIGWNKQFMTTGRFAIGQAEMFDGQAEKSVILNISADLS
jgi:hypothetical protein